MSSSIIATTPSRSSRANASYELRTAARLSSLPAEVCLSQVLVLDQVGGPALEDESSGREDVAAVGDRERHVGVLLDDKDRDSGLVHLLDDLEASLDEDGGQTHRGLVHQHELRSRHEGAPHGHHLLLAA